MSPEVALARAPTEEDGATRGAAAPTRRRRGARGRAQRKDVGEVGLIVAPISVEFLLFRLFGEDPTDYLKSSCHQLPVSSANVLALS